MEEYIVIDEEENVGEWQRVWKKLKQRMKRNTEEMRLESYRKKKMQSEIFQQLSSKEYFSWIKCNIDPKKVGAIMQVQEKDMERQIEETKAWKVNRGMSLDDRCRLCGDGKETVMHLVAGCKVLAATEFTKRHNNALKVLCVEFCKQEGLLNEDTVYYKEEWKQGMIIENDDWKLLWDFEYRLRKTCKQRRPDVTIESKKNKQIWLVDMSFPSEYNVEEKHQEKLNKYTQLAFELRERRPGYKVKILPVVIGCFGGGVEKAEKQVKELIKNEQNVKKVCKEMIKIIVFHSESIVRKVMSGLI